MIRSDHCPTKIYKHIFYTYMSTPFLWGKSQFMFGLQKQYPWINTYFMPFSGGKCSPRGNALAYTEGSF